MVRPKSFGFNSETAHSNSFQKKVSLSAKELEHRVQEEFNSFVNALTNIGVNVTVFDDTADPHKPDAIFPNNWVSCHADGTLVLYPMCTPNRRLERSNFIIKSLKENFFVTNVVDLSGHEKEYKFLEGTGSIIFDHENRKAYACESPRTNRQLFESLMAKLQYEPVYFRAQNKQGVPIYHTNVMMSVGNSFAVVCLSSVSDEEEKSKLINSLVHSHHEIIDITFDQMNAFAGNMLLVEGSSAKHLVMSQTAYDSLFDSQRKHLERYCQLLPVSISTIETIGGGSARCMLAEIFLPERQ